MEQFAESGKEYLNTIEVVGEGAMVAADIQPFNHSIIEPNGEDDAKNH
ncbi:hypothetical protein ACX8XN_03445 [Calditrichota bacterium GD2]